MTIKFVEQARKEGVKEVVKPDTAKGKAPLKKPASSMVGSLMLLPLSVIYLRDMVDFMILGL